MCPGLLNAWTVGSSKKLEVISSKNSTIRIFRLSLIVRSALQNISRSVITLCCLHDTVSLSEIAGVISIALNGMKLMLPRPTLVGLPSSASS